MIDLVGNTTANKESMSRLLNTILDSKDAQTIIMHEPLVKDTLMSVFNAGLKDDNVPIMTIEEKVHSFYFRKEVYDELY